MSKFQLSRKAMNKILNTVGDDLDTHGSEAVRLNVGLECLGIILSDMEPAEHVRAMRIWKELLYVSPGVETVSYVRPVCDLRTPITTRDLHRVVNALINEGGLGPASVNRLLSPFKTSVKVLSSLLNDATVSLLVSPNLEIPWQTPPPPRDLVISDEMISSVPDPLDLPYTAWDRSRHEDDCVWDAGVFLFWVLLDTGVRVGEVPQLLRSAREIGDNVEFLGGRLDMPNSIFIRDTKTGEPRNVPITPRAFFCAVKLSRKWSSPSVRTLQRHVGRVLKGLHPEATAHTLRHTFATRLCRRNVDLRKIAAVMGHTTTHMTERYAHLSDKLASEIAEFVTEMDK